MQGRTTGAAPASRTVVAANDMRAPAMSPGIEPARSASAQSPLKIVDSSNNANAVVSSQNAFGAAMAK